MKTHQLSKTPTYKSWLKMRERCNSPKSNRYYSHGGRGIKVCDRWQSFENFYADMGERPIGTTLNRVNNDAGYSLENCEWATATIQANNRRSNRNITINGETKTFAEWCKTTTLNKNTISSRFYLYGWTIERALGLA